MAFFLFQTVLISQATTANLIKWPERQPGGADSVSLPPGPTDPARGPPSGPAGRALLPAWPSPALTKGDSVSSQHSPRACHTRQRHRTTRTWGRPGPGRRDEPGPSAERADGGRGPRTVRPPPGSGPLCATPAASPAPAARLGSRPCAVLPSTGRSRERASGHMWLRGGNRDGPGSSVHPRSSPTL